MLTHAFYNIFTIFTTHIYLTVVMDEKHRFLQEHVRHILSVHFLTTPAIRDQVVSCQLKKDTVAKSRGITGDIERRSPLLRNYLSSRYPKTLKCSSNPNILRNDKATNERITPQGGRSRCSNKSMKINRGGLLWLQ